MGDVAIKFTPIGASTERTIDFGALDRGLSLFDGLSAVDGHISVSQGGKVFAVTHDHFFEYAVAVDSLTFPVTESDAKRNEWKHLWSWVSSAQRGGEFKFLKDDTKTYSTLLNGARTESGTTLTVDDTTGMAQGDWIYIEDANDQTQWEKTIVESVDTGTQITIPAITNAYADNSIVRYHEYFPACVMTSTGPPLRERPAGRGANLWDLRFKFRTVR